VEPRITVLAGGVGAARFLRGLLATVPPLDVTAVVNVGDDTVLHGLMVSPDLDTVTYTLAGAIDPDTGWGLAGETWHAMGELRRHAGANGIAASDPVGNDAAGWFALGDRDLGTHLYRTSRRRAGATLSQVTAEITNTWGLGLRVLPVTDDDLRTRVTTVEGADLTFQEYFVREQHAVEVDEVRFDGAVDAAPAPGVLGAIEVADVVCIAPSNPVVSIGPLLAVPGVRDAVAAARGRTVAVSPIVGGEALKGPAARLLRELGHEASVVGVARWYRDLAGTLVVDRADEHLADAVVAEGLRCIVTDTIMGDVARAAALARSCIDAVTHQG
jgi:LPPG:FO 2-phospho-L-lactate transferase